MKKGRNFIGSGKKLRVAGINADNQETNMPSNKVNLV